MFPRKAPIRYSPHGNVVRLDLYCHRSLPDLVVFGDFFKQKMKSKFSSLAGRYVAELRKRLRLGDQADMGPALAIGRQAVKLGLETLELARIHEDSLVALGIGANEFAQTKRAEIFFTEAIAPIVDTHRAARQNKSELNRINGELKRRTADLVATNRRLKDGVVRRKRVEASLKNSSLHFAKLLKDSIGLEEDLRRMTRKALIAQEAERSAMSRELHDELAQTLLGINVRLLTLKRDVGGHSKGIKNNIISTQQLVGKTARSTRRVARELRNT
jgi:signal transduction histidine kinase